MKKCATTAALAFAAMAIGAAPAAAQLGGLSGALKKAETVKKVADIKVTEAEEQQIGQEVSAKIVQEFGVLQDKEVARYVTLLGAVLAQASSRPNLPWEFIVLDTDGVNAFAAPGGYVHITKGMLGLMKNEAELAGVLAHEIIHVTEKHTVNAIQKGSTVSVASNEVGSGGGLAQSLVARIAEQAYKDILDNKFSRNDEGESDEKGVLLANGVGYAPAGLSAALQKLSDRNKDAKEPNGLFASHPQLKERIGKIDSLIKSKKLAATALVQPRYAKYVTWDAKAASAISMVAAGTRGLAGGEEKKPEAKTAEAEKKEEPKKKGGFGGALSRLSGSGGGGSQAQQSQTVASAGARGVNPDRDAVGGPNKSKIPVKIGPNDIAEFKKGIA
jgi:predicted Zn-dependent protease